MTYLFIGTFYVLATSWPFSETAAVFAVIPDSNSSATASPTEPEYSLNEARYTATQVASSWVGSVIYKAY